MYSDFFIIVVPLSENRYFEDNTYIISDSISKFNCFWNTFCLFLMKTFNLEKMFFGIDKIRQATLLTNHEKIWYNQFIQSGCTRWKFFYFPNLLIVEKAVPWSWSSQETADFFMICLRVMISHSPIEWVCFSGTH